MAKSTKPFKKQKMEKTAKEKEIENKKSGEYLAEVGYPVELKKREM